MFKGFKKRDYIISFVLAAFILTINLMAPVTVLAVIGVILSAAVFSLVVGTITNLLRKLLKTSNS
ncbi:hypothetical protein CHH91_14760 [Virgibacillus sp. 7505]|nr:hypothetical protein CHH91_14760 [Virgibacillus sp. 7505]